MTDIIKDGDSGIACNFAAAAISAAPSIGEIQRLESAMLDMPQIEIETEHHFTPGMYARQILIKAGTTLVGKQHKTEHLNVCCGDITVWTEGGMRRLTGFHTISSKPGVKRVGYAHADTVWITFHATNETNLDALELELIEPAQPLELKGGMACLG